MPALFLCKNIIPPPTEIIRFLLVFLTTISSFGCVKTNEPRGSTTKDSTPSLPYNGFNDLSWPGLDLKQSGSGQMTDPITQEEFRLNGTTALIYLPVEGNGSSDAFVKDPNDKPYRPFLAAPLMEWWRTGRRTDPITNRSIDRNVEVLIGFKSRKAHPITIEALMAGRKPHESAFSSLPKRWGKINAPGARLEDEPIEGVDARGANFKNSNFVMVDAKNVRFDSASLEYTIFRNVTFDNVTFIKANLKKSWFIHSKLKNTSFRKSVLFLARFNDMELSGVDFRDADLYASKFLRVNFHDTDFRGADLRFAELQGNLQGARFEGANIRGAHIQHDSLDSRMRSLIQRACANGGIVPTE